MTYEERVVRERGRPRSTTGGSTRRRAPGDPDPERWRARRTVVILLFGIVQVLIILRIVLLLLDAREGNDLVSFILNTSQIFVAPFEGMLNMDDLKSGGSVLDVAAILALVGWTVLEALILAAVGIFRREPHRLTDRATPPSRLGRRPSLPHPRRRRRPAPRAVWSPPSGALLA